MNGGQVMVVMIVLIVMITGIFKSRHKSARHGEAQSLMNDPEAARLRDEVQQMTSEKTSRSSRSPKKGTFGRRCA